MIRMLDNAPETYLEVACKFKQSLSAVIYSYEKWVIRGSELELTVDRAPLSKLPCHY